jgi:general stress protein YciG
LVGGDFLEEKKGQMTVQEAGRRGGLKTSETHGEEFYSEIGSKGGSERLNNMRAQQKPKAKQSSKRQVTKAVKESGN